MFNEAGRSKYLVLFVAVVLSSFVLTETASAQLHIPSWPGKKKDQPTTQQQPDPSQMPQMPQMPPMPQPQEKPRKGGSSGPKPPGVPIAMDSPLMQAFINLEQQSSYRSRMLFVANDPQMAQMMSTMGMGPTEMTTVGNTKLVIMHMKMMDMDDPAQMDDWEFRGLTINGRSARLITSPAVPRILKRTDEEIARQMAQQDQVASRAIAESLAQGPLGMISAGVQAASTAASNAEALTLRKKAHDFYTWQCLPPAKTVEKEDRTSPPPLTDLKVIGDQVLEGVPVTTYEFYIKERDKDEFHGPVRLHVAKDTGLPTRLDMTDSQMPGSMRMDYYDVGKVGSSDVEVPPCLAQAKN